MPKTKKSEGVAKVDIPMAPMIDIVFQLLIFFMLNLKIVAPEGNFNVTTSSQSGRVFGTRFL